MKRITVAGVALAAVLAAGCPARPGAPVAPVAEPPTDVVAAVKGTIEQWRQAYEIRSADALGKLYVHEPGLTVVQDGALVAGWVSVEAAVGARLAHATAIRIRIKDLQISALGAAGAVATAAMLRESTEGAATVTENGVITFVLRRDDAGWVIVAEHYSYKRS
jgi:ketosteroid isomerase-like protein